MSLPPGNLHDNEWDKQKYEYIKSMIFSDWDKSLGW